MQSITGSFSVYVERRMARIFLLGIISGFPWVLIGSALSLWLKEDGLSRTTIGWASLIFGVYTVNFLWAPLVDRLRVPWLTDRLGQRRAWIATKSASAAGNASSLSRPGIRCTVPMRDSAKSHKRQSMPMVF